MIGEGNVTSFEHFFGSLKRALGRNNLYDIWPDFEPQFNEREYTWTTISGLGEVLLLNCGQCDGPSDLRHSQCIDCVERRQKIAKDAYQKVKSKEKQKWETLILCRIHTEFNY